MISLLAAAERGVAVADRVVLGGELVRQQRQRLVDQVGAVVDAADEADLEGADAVERRAVAAGLEHARCRAGRATAIMAISPVRTSASVNVRPAASPCQTRRAHAPAKQSACCSV